MTVAITAAQGTKYPHRVLLVGRCRAAAPSQGIVLGTELSDDSLTVSPEQFVLHKPGPPKRDAVARLHPGKRLSISVPRPTRRDSPASLSPAARERSPCEREPKNIEERVLALELQGSADRAEMVWPRST